MTNLLGLAALMAACLTACAAGPEPIRWGTDACDECRMVLTDRRFGVELLDRRPLKFDGLDELGRYLRAHPSDGAIYVAAADTGALLRAEQAVLLASPDLRGPMRGRVVAFASQDAARAFATRERLGQTSFPTLAQALAQGLQDLKGGPRGDR
jgi:copper chaperone NosL